MKKTLFFVLSFCSFTIANAQTKKATTSAAPIKAEVAKPVSKIAVKSQTTSAAIVLKNSKDSASYALGYRIAQSLGGQGLQNINMSIFEKGFSAAKGKSVIPDSLLDVCIKKYQDNMSSEKSAISKLEGQSFLSANAKKPGVVSLPSGLQYQVIVAGTGTTKPTLANTVKCHYHGTLIDGRVFDSSVDRGEPISFPLNGVIKGWQEGLQLMSVGSKFKFYIPSDLAYGDRQAGQLIAPGSTLIFEVELLGVE